MTWVGGLARPKNPSCRSLKRILSLLPELSALPVTAALDGELVAFGPDGAPDFPLLCERMLMHRPGIAVTYMVFDLLSLDGEDPTRAPLL